MWRLISYRENFTSVTVIFMKLTFVVYWNKHKLLQKKFELGSINCICNGCSLITNALLDLFCNSLRSTLYYCLFQTNRQNPDHTSITLMEKLVSPHIFQRYVSSRLSPPRHIKVNTHEEVVYSIERLCAKCL